MAKVSGVSPPEFNMSWYQTIEEDKGFNSSVIFFMALLRDFWEKDKNSKGLAYIVCYKIFVLFFLFSLFIHFFE